MSATRVLLALIIGLVLGALGAESTSTTLARATDIANALGTLWINGIKMTVIPLVAALTVTSVASLGEKREVGRLAGVAVCVFLVLLLSSGFFAMLVAPIGLADLSFTPEVAARLKAGFTTGAAASNVQVPTLAQRIIDMVPVNPIRAAADSAVLPVVVFSLGFGIALTRVAADRRDAVLAVFRSLADAMLILVGWMLRLAAFGVFALAFVLGMRSGLESASAMARYLVTISAVMFAFTLFMYPFVVLAGRVRPMLFARAALPAQAVAFSVRSSLAALPAMIKGSQETLALPKASSGFVLPFAVSVFRLNVPMAWVVGMIFLGELYGVPISQGQLAVLVVTSTLLSFSVPGIPSGSLFLISPVLVQNGIPAEGVGILIALDAIPDMFKTLANVTGHMTSAVVVPRFAKGRA